MRVAPEHLLWGSLVSVKRGWEPSVSALCICNEGDNTMTNPSGYTKPLYLLPFDHRASYISGLFGWKEPLDGEQMVTVANSKFIIYAGFQQAIADHVPKDHAGLLVDEEFGAAILRDAALNQRQLSRLT